MGAALNYALIILNALVALLYTPYMLRMMGQSEFGLYSLVASVISYLTVLDLGFGNAIVRYTAKYRAEGKTREQYEMFGMFLILYLVIGIIAFVGGLGLFFNVDNLFRNTMTSTELGNARIMMLILVFNLAFSFPMSIFSSIISAYERFVFPRTLNIIRVVLNTLIMIVLLQYGYKAVTMVVLQTIFNVLTLIINYIYCKRKLHIEIHYGKFQWAFLSEVAVYSFWIFLNAIMDRIYWSTGQFVLGAVAGTVAISVYAVAIQLQSMYLQFSSAIAGVFLPKVTSMVVLNNNDAELSNLFIKTGRVQNIIMVFVLFVFVLFGASFIQLWVGPEYKDAYVITILFFVSLYVPLIQNLGITILQARNQMKFRSVLYIILAVIALGLEYLLALKWSGIGCAIAISGALFIGQGLIMNIYYKRKQHIDITRFWKEILKMDVVPFIYTLIFGITLRWFDTGSWVHLIICICIYTAVYIPLFYYLSMNNFERSLVKPIINKFKRWLI